MITRYRAWKLLECMEHGEKTVFCVAPGGLVIRVLSSDAATRMIESMGGSRHSLIFGDGRHFRQLRSKSLILSVPGRVLVCVTSVIPPLTITRHRFCLASYSLGILVQEGQKYWQCSLSWFPRCGTLSGDLAFTFVFHHTFVLKGRLVLYQGKKKCWKR